MRSIKFPLANVVFHAPKNEEIPELHAHITPEGDTIIPFQLDAEEIEQIKKTGVIWLGFNTNGKPIQPIYPDVLCPFENPMEQCECGNFELEEDIIVDAEEGHRICRACYNEMTGGIINATESN